jgi:hypothetical protein
LFGGVRLLLCVTAISTVNHRQFGADTSDPPNSPVPEFAALFGSTPASSWPIRQTTMGHALAAHAMRCERAELTTQKVIAGHSTSANPQVITPDSHASCLDFSTWRTDYA